MQKWAFLLLLFCCTACKRGADINMQAVDPHSWHSPVSIFMQNGDTLSLRSISVAVRYNDNFISDTLTVDIQTSLPDARQCRERVLLNFEHKYKGTAVEVSEVVAYREQAQLSQSGFYIFTITPCRAVKGVEAVGIEIRR